MKKQEQEKSIEVKYAVINGAAHRCVVLLEDCYDVKIGLNPEFVDFEKHLFTCYETRRVRRNRVFDTEEQAKHFILNEQVETMQSRLLDMEFFVKKRLNIVFYCCLGVVGCECFGIACIIFRAIFGK